MQRRWKKPKDDIRGLAYTSGTVSMATDFRNYGEEVEFAEQTGWISRWKREEEEKTVMSKPFLTLFMTNYNDGVGDLLVTVLTPDFRRIHSPRFSNNLASNMLKKMFNATHEMTYLKRAFNRLKRLHGKRINLRILFNPKLRSRLYQKWLNTPRLSFRINGIKHYEKAFSMTQINEMRLNFKHISGRQTTLTSDWYDKFLATVYLYWFLSQQSHDIWKIRQSGEERSRSEDEVWPGAYHVIYSNSWQIYDEIILDASIFENKAINWDDPTFSSVSDLPGLNRRTTSDQDVKTYGLPFKNYNDGVRSYEWIYTPHIKVIRVRDHNKRIRYAAIEWAFKSLRLASLIRVPSVTWAKSMLPDEYGGWVVRNKNSPSTVKIAFNHRPSPYVLFNKPTHIDTEDSPTTHFHYWLGGSSEKKGIRLIFANIRFANRLNLIEVLSMIYHMAPINNPKDIMVLQATSIDVPYMVKGILDGIIITEQDAHILKIIVLRTDGGPGIHAEVKDRPVLRASVYNGHAIPTPRRITHHYIETVLTSMTGVAPRDVPRAGGWAWLANLIP